MNKKPVSLSLHKSNIERTRRREVRGEMVQGAKAMASQNNIVAYASVGISDDGRCFALWDTGGVLPMWGFPEAIKSILDEDMAGSGVAEDFRKPLIDKAWKGSL